MSLLRTLFRLALGRRLPQTEGRLSLDGLVEEVEIIRDRWGVPHIRAANDVDAWFAAGFCQGQDRSFQLETLQRLGRGTLAALVGAEALPVDRLCRRIGFYEAARRRLKCQEESFLEPVEAFARGVNCGRVAGGAKKAHEFTLLRAEPTEFTSLDTSAILSLLSFLLAANWDQELARLRIADLDGMEALLALDPLVASEAQSSTVSPSESIGPALERLEEDLDIFSNYASPGGASNNWVLSGSRTASGRPILANDPHLPPSLPAPWYLLHIRTPEWSVAGASLVGTPGVSAGHNGHGAWGVTAGLIDNTDLFIEELGPDGVSVRSAGGFEPCEIREEIIEVKGGKAIEEKVLVTPRGPLISPAVEGESRAISLRAVWLDPAPIGGTLLVHKAKTFSEFRDSFCNWPALSLNVVWGDSSGSIGWQLAGDAPRRGAGNGSFPLPAWSEGGGWKEGRVPYEDMPFLDDPSEGFIATANNPPRSVSGGAFLGVDFIDSYRFLRIREVLASRSDWDMASTGALQGDVESLPWRELKDHFLAALEGDSRLEIAARLLRGWDGRVAADSAAAAVYEFLLAALCRRVARARAPRSADFVLGRGFTGISPNGVMVVRRVSHLIELLRQRPAGWFKGSWDEEIAAAAREALEEIEERCGADPSGWSWGRLHELVLPHPVGEKKILAPIFNRGPYPLGGDTNTVMQAGVDPLHPDASPRFIPSVRFIVDVGEWDNSRFVLPGGQSGNPLSRHYDDQLPCWLRGEGFPIAWSDEAVDAAAVDTLRLSPGTAEG